MASRWLEDHAGNPTFMCRQAWGSSRGARRTVKSRVSVQETKDLKHQTVKESVGIVAVGETSSLTGALVGETPGS